MPVGLILAMGEGGGVQSVTWLILFVVRTSRADQVGGDQCIGVAGRARATVWDE